MHERSIERPSPRFNEKWAPALVALLLATRAAALDVPGSGGRMAIDGYLDGLAVVPSEASQRQRPEATFTLGVDARAASWLRGRVAFRGRAGGPYEGGHPGELSFVHEFQNHTPSAELSEAYLDVLSSHADLRLGVQKLAWGKLDGIPPTDVVNPRDYHDPLVEDFEERKIGIPAVLGTYYLPDAPRWDLAGLRVSLAWLPIATISRVPLLDERWFPASITTVSRVTVPKSVSGLPYVLSVPVDFSTLNHRPPKSFDAGGVAFRLGGTWREMDWNVYHYTGPETGPDTDLTSTVFLDGVNARGELLLHSDAVLRQAHDVVHMTGFDWAAVLFGVTLRAEAAFFQNRPYLRPGTDFYRDSLAALGTQRIQRILVKKLLPNGHAAVPLGDLFSDRDSVEWGVGADYVWHGFIPLLQVNQINFFDDGPTLLVADPETRLTASLRQRLMAERLELEVRGSYAVQREAWFLFPRVSYLVRDDLRVRVGYLAIGGPTASIFGQYADNDEFVFQARYSF